LGGLSRLCNATARSSVIKIGEKITILSSHLFLSLFHSFEKPIVFLVSSAFFPLPQPCEGPMVKREWVSEDCVEFIGVAKARGLKQPCQPKFFVLTTIPGEGRGVIGPDFQAQLRRSHNAVIEY